MNGIGLQQAVPAFIATTVYYLGFVIFKLSAERMPPLRGGRPFTHGLELRAHVQPAGAKLASACISMRLKEPLRKLPQMATTFMG